MSLLDVLERKLGRFAVPNITPGWIACQVIAYGALFLLNAANPEGVPEPVHQGMVLIPERVLAGEVWRLATFLILPPLANPFCMLFFWYLFYLMGTALERYWGVFRFNVFLLLGYVATVAVSFVLPDMPASNAFLQGSVFLAFAYLYPDFELYLFFLLRVKIKWLAVLAWLGYGWVLLFGDWLSRLLVLASVCNFLVFFGKEIVHRARTGWRRMESQAAQFATKEPKYYHRCVVCGITDKSDPKMEFRYCTKCAGSQGYCMDHLRNHEHVIATELDANRG